MAEETFHIPEQNIEYHIVRLLEKLEGLRCEGGAATSVPPSATVETRVELRSLELWRAVICECLATFFYVVVVCGAAGAAGASAAPATMLLATSLASGLAAATLTHCFRHISGAHMNPAVTLALALTRQVTPLRAALFVAAHCGGGIAGAALLYGLTVPGYQPPGNLQAGMVQPVEMTAWERFGVEFILSFIVVLTHCVSAERPRSPFGATSSPAFAIGAVYGACTLVSMPLLNPARALGPAFVWNRWDQQWVVWAGPTAGGAAGALLHTLVLAARRPSSPDSPEPDSSSVQSDEDAYDRLDKHKHHHHGHTPAYSTYRPTAAQHASGIGSYCPTLTATSLYPGGAAANKLERVESLYGGTRSLYCRSPPLTRANLHRSQSVYSKPPRASTAGANAALPPAGPLLPARSLYPPRMDQLIAHNQNAHNQMQARESTYGTRPTNNASSARENPQTNYGPRQNPTGAPGTIPTNETREDGSKLTRRPESMYGMVVSQPRRNQSAQSDDSSYGSYRGAPAPTVTQNGGPGTSVGGYHHHLPPPATHQY